MRRDEFIKKRVSYYKLSVRCPPPPPLTPRPFHKIGGLIPVSDYTRPSYELGGLSSIGGVSRRYGMYSSVAISRLCSFNSLGIKNSFKSPLWVHKVIKRAYTRLRAY